MADLFERDGAECVSDWWPSANRQGVACGHLGTRHRVDREHPWDRGTCRDCLCGTFIPERPGPDEPPGPGGGPVPLPPPITPRPQGAVASTTAPNRVEQVEHETSEAWPHELEATAGPSR